MRRSSNRTPAAPLVFLASLLLACALPTGLSGLQDPEPEARGTATLVGVVTSGVSGDPLAQARVWVVGTDRATLTDDRGHFRLARLPEGPQEVRVGYLGVESSAASVDLVAGKARGLRITFDLELTPIAAQIEGTRGSGGKLRGFRRRMESEQGYYITREDIRSRNPLRTTDMLRRVPGVRISPATMGPSGVTMSGAARRCPIEYYLDGVRAPFLDPDNVPPNDIAGIEIYRGLARVPIQFRHRARGCGVILIWTRDPGNS